MVLAWRPSGGWSSNMLVGLGHLKADGLGQSFSKVAHSHGWTWALAVGRSPYLLPRWTCPQGCLRVLATYDDELPAERELPEDTEGTTMPFSI